MSRRMIFPFCKTAGLAWKKYNRPYYGKNPKNSRLIPGFHYFDNMCSLGYIVVVKKTFRYSNVFFYNDLCRISVFGCFLCGCFAPGYTVLLAPIKALPCLWIFPPMAEKSKPPALRLVGRSEHYYEKRYKLLIDSKTIKKIWQKIFRSRKGEQNE
jgi:hypothetical protein